MGHEEMCLYPDHWAQGDGRGVMGHYVPELSELILFSFFLSQFSVLFSFLELFHIVLFCFT